ncbi:MULTISPECIES: hypothetical protein [unclassified Tolypothrix]|nr:MULTISPECIES: hypothetical protein [unclassified Tolypothrix]EKF02841.1 hypothetical protein FDUTEX481_05642 [Tolypothrix sp. PCC 7601]MBE9087361.1 hypothetical protein [Tolypothrix sp. LEGE 11397]UYD28161.1 hypothetical protein HGR01_09060 [Tolypothrix sp. PCC 7712]UYD35963.1 hypothetical protein HG267_09535 [Tolypothrix sp. PCC 7601]
MTIVLWNWAESIRAAQRTINELKMHELSVIGGVLGFAVTHPTGLT